MYKQTDTLEIQLHYHDKTIVKIVKLSPTADKEHPTYDITARAFW